MSLLASFMNLAGPDLIVILLIVLVLFGAKKLPERRGSGAVRNFAGEFRTSWQDGKTRRRRPHRRFPRIDHATQPDPKAVARQRADWSKRTALVSLLASCLPRRSISAKAEAKRSGVEGSLTILRFPYSPLDAGFWKIVSRNYTCPV
jgi:Sec-independent protein translocase protein TatA